MSRIVYQGGGTRFTPVFDLGLRLMKKKPDVDTVFIMVSDG